MRNGGSRGKRLDVEPGYFSVCSPFREGHCHSLDTHTRKLVSPLAAISATPLRPSTSWISSHLDSNFRPHPLLLDLAPSAPLPLAAPVPPTPLHGVAREIPPKHSAHSVTCLTQGRLGPPRHPWTPSLLGVRSTSQPATVDAREALVSFGTGVSGPQSLLSWNLLQKAGARHPPRDPVESPLFLELLSRPPSLS